MSYVPAIRPTTSCACWSQSCLLVDVLAYQREAWVFAFWQGILKERQWKSVACIGLATVGCGKCLSSAAALGGTLGSPENALFLRRARQQGTASPDVPQGVLKVVLVQVLSVTVSPCWTSYGDVYCWQFCCMISFHFPMQWNSEIIKVLLLVLNSPKKRSVVGSRGAGCGGRAGWGNPSQVVVLAVGLFVNLPPFGFPPLLPTLPPGSKYSCLGLCAFTNLL